jgi:dihydrofolate reductase
MYEAFYDLVENIYVSEVDFDGEADTYFTPINENMYKLVHEEIYESTEKTPSWKFKKFTKR